eukprot:scaffold3031_cov102-Cylindrotheca_fusiformis.AAC.12
MSYCFIYMVGATTLGWNKEMKTAYNRQYLELVPRFEYICTVGDSCHAPCTMRQACQPDVGAR